MEPVRQAPQQDLSRGQEAAGRPKKAPEGLDRVFFLVYDLLRINYDAAERSTIP